MKRIFIVMLVLTFFIAVQTAGAEEAQTLKTLYGFSNHTNFTGYWFQPGREPSKTTKENLGTIKIMDKKILISDEAFVVPAVSKEEEKVITDSMKPEIFDHVSFGGGTSEIFFKDGTSLKIEALVSINPRIMQNGKVYLSISAWDSPGRDGKRLYRNVYACE